MVWCGVVGYGGVQGIAWRGGVWWVVSSSSKRGLLYDILTLSYHVRNNRYMLFVGHGRRRVVN